MGLAELLWERQRIVTFGPKPLKEHRLSSNEHS
jgi:hypothetical protein